MSIQHTHTRRSDFRSTTGTTLAHQAQPKSVTGDSEITKRIAMMASEADKLVDVALTAANLKGIYLLASSAVTIKTNSTGAPANTLELLPNQAYSWLEGDLYVSNFITVDVTAIYLTENSGQATEVKMEFLSDVTP